MSDTTEGFPRLQVETCKELYFRRGSDIQVTLIGSYLCQITQPTAPKLSNLNGQWTFFGLFQTPFASSTLETWRIIYQASTSSNHSINFIFLIYCSLCLAAFILVQSGQYIYIISSSQFEILFWTCNYHEHLYLNCESNFNKYKFCFPKEKFNDINK